jgi:hypothetical protein
MCLVYRKQMETTWNFVHAVSCWASLIQQVLVDVLVGELVDHAREGPQGSAGGIRNGAKLQRSWHNSVEIHNLAQCKSDIDKY